MDFLQRGKGKKRAAVAERKDCQHRPVVREEFESRVPSRLIVKCFGKMLSLLACVRRFVALAARSQTTLLSASAGELCLSRSRIAGEWSPAPSASLLPIPQFPHPVQKLFSSALVSQTPLSVFTGGEVLFTGRESSPVKMLPRMSRGCWEVAGTRSPVRIHFSQLSDLSKLSAGAGRVFRECTLDNTNKRLFADLLIEPSHRPSPLNRHGFIQVAQVDFGGIGSESSPCSTCFSRQ